MMIRHSARFSGRFGIPVVAGILLVLLSSPPVWSAVTGKIAGVVVNKKTKEPLIGCAVQIEGTTIGVISDVDGKFTILAVPPGEHSVRAKLIGHTDMIVHNTLVKPDQTTVVNFELEESAVELKPIEVIRKADLIQMDQASTKRDVTAEKIKTLPVVTVGDILKTQVGVTVRNDRFHIRGGRSSELIYTVDGVSMTDPLGGRGPSQALNLSGTEIENVSIIKGAWSPEYGGTSGIVNVATKEGDQQVTRGHMQYFTDDLGIDRLNKYSFNYRRLEFNIGGPEPLLTRRLFPSLGLEGLSDKLAYYVSLDYQQSDSYTPVNTFTTPLTRASFRQNSFLGLDFFDRQNNAGNALLKLTYRVHPDIRLTGTYKNTTERTREWDDLTWNYRFTPNTHPWVEDRTNAYSMRMTHNLGPSTYYEVLVSRYDRHYWQKPGDPNNPGGTLNPNDFPIRDAGDQRLQQYMPGYDSYFDRNGDGRWDPPEAFTDVYPDGEYTFGDIFLDRNNNGNFDLPDPASDDPIEFLGDSLIYDFNRNHQYDFDSGEPFVDRNYNGTYDEGDLLTRDGNGNGQYDPGRETNMYDDDNATAGGINDQPEPYVDGDASLGEPFEDINRNGIWDDSLSGYVLGEPFNDLSHNSKYDGPSDPWVPGVPYRDLNGNGEFDPGADIGSASGQWSSNDEGYQLGEPFYDRNGDGMRNPADHFYDRGYDELVVWHDRRPISTTVKWDLVSQMRREHEVKVGLSYSAYDLRFKEVQKPYLFYSPKDSNEYRELVNDPEELFSTHIYDPLLGLDTVVFRGALRDFYHQKPATGALYLVDKMEYGQMIAQVGFRYEFFVQSNQATRTNAAVLDTGSIEDYRDKFAPRIAFSYPISDKAKVFFNYGHFYQLPDLYKMYRRSTQTTSVSGTIGNVNLDYVKTIKYEFGLQYLLSPEYVLSLQGFYTDDFGRVSESEATGVRSTQERKAYENSDYSRARGLEAELEKKYGNYVSGTITYNFSYAYGKSSAEALDYFVNFYRGGGGRFRLQEFPLDWDERHKITFILDLRIPAHDHPKLFGFSVPDNMGLNVFWQYGSGFPYTPTRDHPGVARTLIPGEDPLPNSERYPSRNNVDVRFNKDFKVGRLGYTLEVWVNNLFDARQIEFVDRGTGRPETDLIKTVIYQSNNPADPRNWGAGRQIRLGMGVNF